MAATIQKRETDDPAVAALLAARPGYVFQEPVWGRVLATLGHPVWYYCLEDSGSPILAQLAVEVRLGFFRILWCGLPFGGPAGDVSRAAEFFDLLVPAAARGGIHRIRLSRNFYDGDMPAPAAESQEHVQQVLHFGGRTAEKVWEDFKGRVRRDIRVGEKAGLQVVSGDQPALRDALHAMYAATMARNESFVFWTREMIEEIWRSIVQPGQGEILMAMHEGQPLAGIITLYSGRRCFYFMGASAGEKRNLCPNDAIIWEAIRRAAARGCEDFDFMTSSREDQRLIEFKAKWGTERHPFFFYERDLKWLPCRLWNVSFAVARTRLGARLVRLIRR